MPSQRQTQQQSPGQPLPVNRATSPNKREGSVSRAREPGGASRPLKTRDLIPPGEVLELDHDGQIYRLRITRNHKLILTK